MKSALIFQGGWDGHEPHLTSKRFASILQNEGYSVEIYDTLDCLKDAGELKKLDLSLNKKKSIVVRKGQKQTVTGIVVNEKLSIPNSYKKKIRQEIYYCMKFGVESHLEKANIEIENKTLKDAIDSYMNLTIDYTKDNIALEQEKAWDSYIKKINSSYEMHDLYYNGISGK